MTSQRLIIDNEVITTNLYDIVLHIKTILRNGKLKVVSKPRDNNIKVTCPHHKNGLENTPAGNIYVGESNENVQYGWYSCFVCHFSGPFYHFVAECFDSTDQEAKNWLISNYADKSLRIASSNNFNLEEIILKKPTQNIFLDESILNSFEDFHPYMLQRKLTKDVCKKLEIKYDSKSQMLVFPVRDEYGKLVMLTKRSVNSKLFIIDKEKDKPVYLLNHLLKNNIKEAYICESQINAATLWTHNLPGIALIGTGSRNQYDILNKSPIRIYNLLFDGDEAGDNGIKNFLKNIRKDVLVNIIPVPRGKDVNDLSFEELEELIKKYK